VAIAILFAGSIVGCVVALACGLTATAVLSGLRQRQCDSHPLVMLKAGVTSAVIAALIAIALPSALWLMLLVGGCRNGCSLG
jgi:hypothetical protein